MNFKKRVNGSWADTPNYIHKTDTDIITTLPAVLYPTGTTATVGLKGQTVQSSVPSPTSPVMPQGCGERTGNLLDADMYYGSYKSGSTYTATTSQFNTTVIAPFTEADIGNTYTISCDITDISSTNVRWIATIGGVNVNGDGRANAGQIKLTFTVATTSDNFKITYGSGNISLTITNIMLNSGSTPLPYEPYGYKIPISSGGQTTPVYLGEVQTTRKIKKLVLTGDEDSWHISGNFFFNDNINPDYLRTSYRTVYCTHYQGINNVTTGSQVGDGKCAFYSVVGVQRLYIKDSNYSTVESFTTYLQQQYTAGTPVTVWYVLAEPTTGIVNEPLRKIGDYADTVSGVSIPTTTGKDTFDVLTTLKPSEVSLTYTGWHDATVKEWDGSDWQ